jgi:hypothetical protein
MSGFSLSGSDHFAANRAKANGYHARRRIANHHSDSPRDVDIPTVENVWLAVKSIERPFQDIRRSDSLHFNPNIRFASLSLSTM